MSTHRLVEPIVFDRLDRCRLLPAIALAAVLAGAEVGVFSYEPKIVPGSRSAVPAP